MNSFCDALIVRFSRSRHANCRLSTFRASRHFPISVRVLLPADRDARPDLGLSSGRARPFGVKS